MVASNGFERHIEILQFPGTLVQSCRMISDPNPSFRYECYRPRSSPKSNIINFVDRKELGINYFLLADLCIRRVYFGVTCISPRWSVHDIDKSL